MMSKQARKVARMHKLLGLVVGLQLLFWTVSGFFFTLFPIEAIRGEHLKQVPPYAALASDAQALVGPDVVLTREAEGVQQILLKPFVNGPVYEVTDAQGSHLYDGKTGERLSPVDEALARQIALAHWAGDGALVTVTLVETPPREAGAMRPLWRAAFQGKDTAVFWIDPQSGHVKAVRTTKWRVFDVMWRFHIMDVTGADRFDSWWLKLSAFLGLTTVLFGIALLFDRARKRRLLK